MKKINEEPESPKETITITATTNRENSSVEVNKRSARTPEYTIERPEDTNTHTQYLNNNNVITSPIKVYDPMYLELVLKQMEITFNMSLEKTKRVNNNITKYLHYVRN